MQCYRASHITELVKGAPTSSKGRGDHTINANSGNWSQSKKSGLNWKKDSSQEFWSHSKVLSWSTLNSTVHLSSKHYIALSAVFISQEKIGSFAKFFIFRGSIDAFFDRDNDLLHFIRLFIENARGSFVFTWKQWFHQAIAGLPGQELA
jgi:hypothetical protein